MGDIEIYSYAPFEAEISKETDRHCRRYEAIITFVHGDRRTIMDAKAFGTREEAYDWALGSIEELADSLERLRKKVEGVA